MNFKALRGLKTLHLRMEASQKSAMIIATYLEQHENVLKVSTHFNIFSVDQRNKFDDALLSTVSLLSPLSLFLNYHPCIIFRLWLTSTLHLSGDISRSEEPPESSGSLCAGQRFRSHDNFLSSGNAHKIIRDLPI